MSGTTRPYRWLQRVLLVAVAAAACASLCVGIWLPSSDTRSLLPLSATDFEREISLGNVYGYGLTVPVTAHGSSDARYLRIVLGDSVGFTGFGVVHSASLASGGHLQLRWRARGSSAYIAVELQTIQADLPGRATWFAAVDAPGPEWSDLSIPLTEFEWNAATNPPDWPVRPLDPSMLYGFSLTLPPGADVEIDIATLAIQSSNSKNSILVGLVLLAGFLGSAWYVLLLLGHQRHAEQSLVVSEQERRRLEDQLVQSQKMEAVGLLAGGISHDFNNLLTGIMGACDLASRYPDEREQVSTWLEQIRELSQRAAGITGQLLAFSREQPLQRNRLSVNALVADGIRLTEHICGPDVVLTVETEATADTILADETRIQQTLINLAVNAHDAMPDGGTLSFHTDNVTVDDRPDLTAGNYLRLRVRDTGRGIDHETKSHIFDPFFTTKEVGKGTGLGLSIVHRIIGQHDGVIDVESTLGQGTEFSILLPALDSAAEDLRAPAKGASMLDGDETIVVVDDDKQVRKMVMVLLQRRGYRVLTAGSPAEADDCLSPDDPVDLLLSDIAMPGESGPAYYQRLRQRIPDLPVLFMTGYADQEGGSANGLDPAWPLILKPFNPTQLCRKIRTILDASREA
jgi:signal transduction histidine kinase